MSFGLGRSHNNILFGSSYYPSSSGLYPRLGSHENIFCLLASTSLCPFRTNCQQWNREAAAPLHSQRCCNRHNITTERFIECRASVSTSWFYLSLSGSISPPQPTPRPTAAPQQNARWSETRGPRGILLLSNCCHQLWFCLHTAASLSPSLGFALVQQPPFFLCNKQVSSFCGNIFFGIFILFVIFGLKSFFLFICHASIHQTLQPDFEFAYKCYIQQPMIMSVALQWHAPYDSSHTPLA